MFFLALSFQVVVGFAGAAAERALVGVALPHAETPRGIRLLPTVSLRVRCFWPAFERRRHLLQLQPYKGAARARALSLLVRIYGAASSLLPNRE